MFFATHRWTLDISCIIEELLILVAHSHLQSLLPGCIGEQFSLHHQSSAKTLHLSVINISHK